MKIRASDNQANFEEFRSKIETTEQVQAWDDFWEEVIVFDSNDDIHVQKARFSCWGCGPRKPLDITYEF